jgi:hypothetical protein
VALEGGFDLQPESLMKKATGMEFARGSVPKLGKAKYEQAHSA